MPLCLSLPLSLSLSPSRILFGAVRFGHLECLMGGRFARSLSARSWSWFLCPFVPSAAICIFHLHLTLMDAIFNAFERVW